MSAGQQTLDFQDARPIKPGSAKEMVLGFGPMDTSEPGLLNRWTRFETIATAMQYFTLWQHWGTHTWVLEETWPLENRYIPEQEDLTPTCI
ncbi:MAG: hypothetical protein R2778_15255 [Saprospiraceae bacterium]